MKIYSLKHILVLCFAVAFGLEGYGQQAYTPFGTPIQHAFFMEDTLSTAQKAAYREYVATYQTVTLLSDADNSYNCHGYAWYTRYTHQNVWINNSLISNNTGQLSIFTLDGSFTTASSSESYDAIVTYNGGDHSAVMTNTPQSQYVISKWGRGPLVRHYLYDCPYYATSFSYYKRRPLYLEIWNNDTGAYLGTANDSMGPMLNSNTRYHIRLNTDASTHLTNFQWETPAGWTIYYVDSSNGLLSINTNSSPGGILTLKAKSTYPNSVQSSILTVYVLFGG